MKKQNKKKALITLIVSCSSLAVIALVSNFAYKKGYSDARIDGKYLMIQYQDMYSETLLGLNMELSQYTQELVSCKDIISDLNSSTTELTNLINSRDIEINKLTRELREYKDNGMELFKMASIIQRDSYPKVSRELAEEIALYVWNINITYADKYGFEFDPYLTLAFMNIESNFNPKANSYADAKGITQLMDRTGKAYANKLGYNNYNPYDWKQNIDIGWYYYNENMQKYGEHKAIVVYNQGFRNLSKAVEVSLKSSTSYLTKILEKEAEYEGM